MKRRLMESFFFDFESADWSIYMPHVSIYWVHNEPDFPVTMRVAYDGSVVHNKMEFSTYVALDMISYARDFIRKSFPDYRGDLEMDEIEHYHRFQFGGMVKDAPNRRQVDVWIIDWLNAKTEEISGGK